MKQIVFAKVDLPDCDDSYLEKLRQRYARLLHQKSVLKIKRDKLNLLVFYLNDEWQTSEQMAKVTGLSWKCTSRLLIELNHAGKADIKTDEWVDSDSRERKRYMYRRIKPAAALSIFNKLWPQMVLEIKVDPSRVTVHRLKG